MKFEFNKIVKTAAMSFIVLVGGVLMTACHTRDSEMACNSNEPVVVTNPKTGENAEIEKRELVLGYAQQFVKDSTEFEFTDEQEEILIKKWCYYENKIEGGSKTHNLKVLKEMNKDFERTIDDFQNARKQSNAKMEVPNLNI